MSGEGSGGLETWRPWFSLYGVRLKAASSAVAEHELAPIQRMLPEEILHNVFALLPAYALGLAQCVCRQWRLAGARRELWRAACADAFALHSQVENEEIVRREYRGSWKAMFLQRPHLRYDGLYVSRNTYLKRGVVEWRTKQSVHLCLCFRYLRFLPDGRVLNRISPEVPRVVAKCLVHPPARREGERGGRRRGRAAAEGESVHEGTWQLQGNRVLTRVCYNNSHNTMVEAALRLRSSVQGANNLLDILSLQSREQEGEEGGQDAGDDGGAQRSHNRFMTTYVFVPWEYVNTTILNLPVTELDYYIPG